MLLMGQSIASDTLVSRNAFYSFWRDAGFPVDFEFKHYHIWNEPVFFRDFAATAKGDVAKRIGQIRKLKPGKIHA